MKPASRLFFLTCIISSGLTAQESSGKIKDNGIGSNNLSLGLKLPFGEFEETHGLGSSLSYSRTNGRFGRMEKIPVPKLGWIAHAGVTWYRGKKETTDLVYTYNYPHFWYISLQGGVIYSFFKNGKIIFSAGPALGSYDGDERFMITANMQGSYNLWERIAISPGFELLKGAGSGPLAAATIELSFAF